MEPKELFYYELAQDCLSHGENFGFITYTLFINEKQCVDLFAKCPITGIRIWRLMVVIH